MEHRRFSLQKEKLDLIKRIECNFPSFIEIVRIFHEVIDYDLLIKLDSIVKPRISTRGNLEVIPDSRKVKWKGCDVSLSGSQFLLVDMLSRHPDTIFTRQQIHDQIYGWQKPCSERCIDAAVRKIRRSFESADFRFRNIVTVYGLGYKWSKHDTMDAIDSDPN